MRINKFCGLIVILILVTGNMVYKERTADSRVADIEKRVLCLIFLPSIRNRVSMTGSVTNIMGLVMGLQE